MGLVIVGAGLVLFACEGNDLSPCSSASSCEQGAPAGRAGLAGNDNPAASGAANEVGSGGTDSGTSAGAGGSEAGAPAAGAAVAGMGTVGEAGQMGLAGWDAGAGGEGEVSAACGTDCVKASDAPWIVYWAGTSDSLLGVKSDLIGRMQPVILTPPLQGSNDIEEDGNWSPDRKCFIVRTGYTQIVADAGIHHAGPTYLVKLGGALPSTLTLSDEAADFTWSPSGKHLFFRKPGIGLYDWDITTDTQTLVVANPLVNKQAQLWFKADAELLVLVSQVIYPYAAQLVRLARQGDAWTSPVSADIGPSVSGLTVDPNLTQATYLSFDTELQKATLWSLQLTAGAVPNTLAGPADALSFQPSPDGTQYLLAADDKVSGETSLFGGAMATLSSPPLLEHHKTGDSYPRLSAWELLPRTAWSPNSVYAAVFQPGAEQLTKQLAVYQPGAAESLRMTGIAPQDARPGVLLWSPNSRELVSDGQAPGSDRKLYVINPTDGSKQEIGNVGVLGNFGGPQFSAGGELFAFAGNTYQTKATSFRYFYLQLGPAGAATPHDISGWIDERGFGGSGTGFVFFVPGVGCSYVDLTSTTPAQPVDPTHVTGTCRLQ